MGFHDVSVNSFKPADPHASGAQTLSRPPLPARAQTTAVNAPPAAPEPARESLSQAGAASGKARSQIGFVDNREAALGDFRQAIAQSGLAPELKQQLLAGKGLSQALAREAYQAAASAGGDNRQKIQNGLLMDVFWHLGSDPAFRGREQVSLGEAAQLAGEIKAQQTQLRQLRHLLAQSSIPEPLGQKILVGEPLEQSEAEEIYHETCIGAQADPDKASRAHDAKLMDLFWRLANAKLSLSPDQLKAQLAEIGK